MNSDQSCRSHSVNLISVSVTINNSAEAPTRVSSSDNLDVSVQMADLSPSIEVSMARLHSYAVGSIMSVQKSTGESDGIGSGVNACNICSLVLRVIVERRSEGKSVSDCPASARVNNNCVGAG